MSVAPIYQPFLDDEIKMKKIRHTKKQLAIGKNIKSISLDGTQILNWDDSKIESTLYRESMMVESIFEKKVISGNPAASKKENKFKGRLSHAIVPNQRTKMATFYFSKANAEESRIVARGLPLFIRDYYNLDPSYFYSNDAIANSV